MGVQKLETLPKEAVPLTRHTDIKLVLDTPKGMFLIMFSFPQSHMRYNEKRGGKSEAEEGRGGKRRKEEENAI